MEDVMKQISYGLYIVTARQAGMDNGCIVNTVFQITQYPVRIALAVNKQNLTHKMILETGKFNVSILTTASRFSTYRHWGMQTGREADKMNEILYERSPNGLIYITEETNGFMSCHVEQQIDLGTHTLFIAEVTDSKVISQDPSATYAFYQKHIKPQVVFNRKKAYICTVCGYIYEDDNLPADYVCPVCKHGAADFVPMAA